ncbi:MFS transporter [Salinibacterium soli]|uniref:Multidrug efflux pump Tap n=1 Tax=Antiquaquibacter soli TaxID=3064523 RepID=A0ABT9BPT3_9MICO|nr:MFS transporter [Protaetiibacter sp. WY-16]MDO7883035.1 MFS transporter [Protaetiibacter sp. WY-16]
MRRSAVLYFAADFASLLGNSAIGLVLPWLVLVRTGDPAAAGLVAAASAAPGFVAAIVGGALIDRLGRRRVTILADVGSAVAVALLPVVDATLGLSVAWFVGLGILGALFDVPGMTARDALLPDVARASGLPIDRVSGIRESLFGASFLAGPLLAGAGLAVLPAPTVLWLTAGCSALAALLTLALPRTVGATPAERPKQAGWAALREGLGTLRGSPVALATTLLAVGSVLAISPLQGVVLPVLFEAIDAPGLLGLTLATFAVGLIGGSLGYGPLAGRIGRRRVLVTALTVSLVGVAAFAVAPIPAVAFGAAVCVGFGFGVLNPMFPVLVAERIPESARGRVLGLQNAGYLAAFPLGVLLAGLVVSWGGVQAGAVATAAVWAVIVVLALRARGLRDLEPVPAPAPPTS